MAWSVVASTATTSGSTAVTDAIDTSSADLLVVGVASYRLASFPPTLSDNKSNSWTALSIVPGVVENPSVRLFYAWNALVGSGHTFTAADASAPGLAVLAVSGSQVSSACLDAQAAGASTNTSTVAPGACSAAALDLLVTVLGFGSGGTYAGASIDSAFTKVAGVSFSAGYGIALAWFTSASSQNPTWTTNGGNDNTAALASFTPAAAPSGQPAMRRFGRAPLGVDGVRIY